MHRPTQQGRPARAFAGNNGFKAFANQRRAVGDTGQHRGLGKQLVINVDGGTDGLHQVVKASVYDVI